MLVRLYGKGNHHSLLVVMQIGSATTDISIENPPKPKNKSTMRPRSTISLHVPKDSPYFTDTCSTVFIAYSQY